MRRWTGPAFLTGLVALLAAPGAGAQTEASSCPGGQTLTAAELEARGWGRLHEALRWSDALDAPSVDGYDVLPTVRAVGAGRLRWLVDGLPAAGPAGIEPDGIEHLPVALAEIARVTVCPGPGLAAGAWGGPWVEVETRRPARVAGGAVDYGNETGDPGPARYLTPGAPNVDHWGPDFEAVAVAGPGLWASLRDRGLFPTDTAMAARVFEAVRPGRFPARAVTVAALHASARGWTARGGIVRGADLPHVPALGREVPVARRHASASAGGPVARVGPVALVGRLHAARLALRRPAWGALALDPAWTETRVVAGLDGAVARPGGTLRAGLQAEHIAADAPGLTGSGLADRRLTVGRLWGEASAAADSGHARTATLALTTADGDVALGGGITQRWPLARGGHVTVSLAAHRRAGRDGPTLADWTAAGYAGLGGTATLAPDVLGAPAGSVPPQGEAVVRLAGRRPLTPALAAEWTAEVQQSEGPYERPRFTLAPDGAAVTGGTETRRAAGVAGSLRGALVWTRGAVGVRVFARVQGPLPALGRRGAARDAFAEAWDRQPVWRGGAEATLRPDARLALWARLDASAATRWAGYPDSDVPAAVLVDVGASRRFWGGRLRLSLAGRNGTGGWAGATERPHPLGATLAPRLFVRVDARF